MFKLFIIACFLTLATAIPHMRSVANTGRVADDLNELIAAASAPLAYSAYLSPVGTYSTNIYAAPYTGYFVRR